MKSLATALGLVLAVGIASALSGALRADIAVAVHIGLVSLTAILLVLTSRTAPAPVGYVPRQVVRTVAAGVPVRAAPGARA